jgi:prepilin-type N-terminal cleavage/methylation domain-containing protein
MELKSEKGITLIEVLAALTILSIVFGVGFMLFFSINKYWDSSTTRFNYKQEATRTVNTINEYLADCEEVWYGITSTKKELRIVTGVGEGDYIFKTVIWEENESTISISTLSGATRLNFNDPTLSFTLTDTIVLSTHVHGMVVGLDTDDDGTEINEWTTNTHKANGELLEFSVTIDMGNGSTQEYRTIHKLMSNPFTFLPDSMNLYC